MPDEDLAALEAHLSSALSPSYILVRRLGTGGMGSVFLARDPALKRLVAVKVLSPALAADPAARTRFEREAQAVAQLSHPNIVAIHSVGQLEDGPPYFVMQFVGGRSLAARLAEEGPFAAEETRQIIGEVASALAAAHQRGIIHRDIKPANVLYDDDSGRVLVSDFGIAAVRPAGERRAETRLTMTGMAVGTPQYMSPEQLLAEEVTEKTDVYALGLLGYELLAGASPYQATTPQELIAAHLRDTPKPLTEIRDDVDPELESAVTACLSKKPEDRPTSAELAQRFLRGSDHLLEWPPPGLAPLHGRLRRVTNALAVGSVLVALALLALLLVGPGLSSAVTSFASLFILVLGLAGVGVMLFGIWKLIQLGTVFTRAVRSGFRPLTVLETAGDTRGDTGAVIAGAREYATLGPEVRQRMRRSRLAHAASQLVAGVLPVVMVVPYAWAASHDLVGDAAAPIVLLGPSLALALLGGFYADRERRIVGPIRKRLGRYREKRERDPALTRSWNEAYGTACRGQPWTAGPDVRPAAGYVGAIAGGLGLIGILATLLPIAAVGVLGPMLWQILVPKLANMEEKYRIAQAARRYALPADSSITPLEAGRAIYALSEAGRRDQGGVFPQHPPMELAPWSDRAFPEGLFTREVSVGDEGPRNARYQSPSNAPNPMWVLEYTSQGLEPAERTYLAELAAAPEWDLLRVAARAPVRDYLGARYVIPFPDNADHWAMPILRFAGTKDIAYRNTSRAAYLMSQGRLAEAEEVLRETISYGFALADDGNTPIEALVGIVIVGIGRTGLESFYRLTDPREAAALRASYDSVTALVNALDEVQTGPNISDARALRRQMIAVARDTARLRGLRVELLSVLSLATCTNVRELLFGPDADIQTTFAEAREDLARFDSERALVELIARAPERGTGNLPGVRTPLPFRITIALGDVSSWLLGNPRIAGCTRWVTQGMHLASTVN